MSHHGMSELERIAQEHGFDQFKKSMQAPQAERIDELIMKSKQLVGQTGNFPDGKLNEQDQGEIMVGITTIEDRVVMNFGNPIKWIGFTKEQAISIAESLIKHAK